MAEKDPQLSMDSAGLAGQIALSKTIILFSDGTGNSSGKQQKTNVWRMYQTVDLGVPEQRNHRVQIGRYDNGVGTTAFRILAMIQGIFGWGLKRNILSLYLFLCKNYSSGDSICLFGFSRGAYTVRVLADLIDTQGIIPSDRGGALDYLVRDAYRAYRRRQRPRMLPMRALVPMFKWAAEWVRKFPRPGRVRYDPAANDKPDVAFVGVWDTVGAYGGPILEFVRGVDDWIVPITFASKKLPKCVRAARHALALDDERDSFQPLPWSESKESRDRLQQVWFAGMHSDVGGGYPDDSLSYVSFIWMLDEARACAGIRFRPDREEEARKQADSFGPIHDSRAGFGGYYRYQPRKISALMWPTGKGTESLVDPEQPKGEGMRRPALIHDSVFQRILSGTDRYSPIAVTPSYEIAENLSAKPNRALPAAHKKRFSDPKWQSAHEKAQEQVWDGVWKRRIVYFAIVLLSLGVALSPLAIERFGWSYNGPLADLVRIPLQWAKQASFGRLDGWLDPVIQFPWLTLLLAAAIIGFFKLSTWFEKRLRARCRGNWALPTSSSSGKAPRKSAIFWLRRNWFYQKFLGRLRWILLPSIVGILVLIALFSAFMSMTSIVRLTWNGLDDGFCPRTWPAPAAGNVFWMATDNPCNPTSTTVVRGQKYEVVFAVPVGEQWFDGDVPANPAGQHRGGPVQSLIDLPFAGMRRDWQAQWMQPLAHIVSRNGASYPASTRPIEEISVQTSTGNAGRVLIYRGRFTADATGHLALAVNEAVPTWPLRRGLFYDGRLFPGSGSWSWRNRGGACVHVVEASGKLPAAAPPGRRPRRCVGLLP